jgi:cytochrome c6
MFRPLVGLAVLAAFGATSCARELANGSVDGAEVFASTCAMCHGDRGKPTAAMVLKLNVRDLTAPEFRGRVTQELVEKQVRHGSGDGRMPAFAGGLSDAQITAVATFVITELGAGPAPAPSPSPPAPR